MKNPPTLLTLMAAALALGLAGLLPAVVCLLVVALIVLVGVLVPARFPQLTATSWGRSGVAMGALGLIVLFTAATGPQNLLTGTADSPLAAATNVLAVPDGLPLGLLAALAAGSLIAVTLEVGHRRGTQSALVLGTAVLGLACVAAPSGLRLLVPIAIGWPAALLALTRLNFLAAANPEVRTTITRRGPGPAAATESALVSAFRWRVVPVLLALGLSTGLAVAAGGSDLRNLASANAAGDGNFGDANSARAWDSKFLGGRMNLNSRGPLGENPVAEVPADSPAHWRTATLDHYTGEGWQVTGTPSLSTTISPTADGVRLATDGNDSAEGDGGASDADPSETNPDPDLDVPDATATTPSTIDDFPADPDLDLSNPADPGDFGIGESDPDPVPSAGTGAEGGADSLEQPTTQAGVDRTDLVVIRGNGTAQLIAPGRVTVANLPANYAQRTFVSTGDRVLLPSQDGDEYSVSSQVYPDTSRQASLGTALTSGVAAVQASSINPRYLQVPQSLPARVRQLGQDLVDASPNQFAAVQAVEARLGRMMTYTLDAGVPPEGQDAVDFALFESGEGYCEHFASAEVMLLRSAGIPARMVVGYLADGQDLTDDGRQVIRQGQAHAWVEVWFPGTGWVTSDPTPAGGIEQSFLESMNSVFNRTMNDIAERATAFFVGVVGPAVLAGILLLGWLFRRPLLKVLAKIRGRGSASSGEGTPGIDPDLRKAFTELESALSARGAARSENETLGAFQDRLVGSRYFTEPEQKAALELAFDVLNRALYARTPPGRDECLEAADIFGEEVERQRDPDQPVVSLGQSAQLM